MAIASPDDADKKQKPIDWASSLDRSDITEYTRPSALIPSLVVTAVTLALIRFYKVYLRRIPNTEHIKPSYYRKRSIFGVVTSVGDADNFRLFHTPGGRIAGWGWLPWKKIPGKSTKLKGKTVGLQAADRSRFAHANFFFRCRYRSDSQELMLRSKHTLAMKDSPLETRLRSGYRITFYPAEFEHTYTNVISMTG
jgi:hypothetical protein